MPKIKSTTPKPANRFCDLIGLQFTEMEKGFCRTELTVTDTHLNPYGSLHGGVVYTLADTGMGGALSTLLEEDERCSTLEKPSQPDNHGKKYRHQKPGLRDIFRLFGV